MATTAARPQTTYDAAVIGAGPAGVAVVARLLDAGASSVAWIDPQFNGGRLQQYPEVPSNTKTKLFVAYANMSPTLAQAAQHVGALNALLGMPQDEGCALAHAQQLTRDLARGLPAALGDTKVHAVRGWTREAAWHSGEEQYTLTVDASVRRDPFDRVPEPVPEVPAVQEVRAKALYVCTGSEPVPTPPAAVMPHALHASAPVEVLPLDVALTPSKLTAQLAAYAKEHGKPAKVAVVGLSHSAVLCIKNVADAGTPAVVFARAMPLYAEYLKDEVTGEDWILYDNTGLKGVAAQWCRATIEDSAARKAAGIELVHLASEAAEPALYRAHLQGVTHIVYAIGFRTRPLPAVTVDGTPVSELAKPRVAYNPKTGALPGAPRAFGFGIAFPEQTVDRRGNVEWSVGMFKFMRYITAAIKAPGVAAERA